MIIKYIQKFEEFLAFWEQETDSSEQQPLLKDLMKFIYDLGFQKMSVCMSHEDQLKWVAANEVVIFLRKIIFDS